MACVHCLEHIEGFWASDFADDQAVRPHSQGVFDQVANCVLAPAFNIGRSGFETDKVLLLELQFSGVFNCDDSLILRDETAKNVEGRCFSAAGSA